MAVMGGGGGGGGAGGKGSKKGKGKKGAGKKKGKNGAKGGKKGSKKNKKCGAGGKGGKCTKHNKKGSAGHPVDVATGTVYTVAATDLALPGPLPLRLERQYSSGAHERDVGLGAGWSHSFAWTLEEGRRDVTIWSDDGTAYTFEKPRIGESVLGEDGWRLGRVDWGYVLEADEDELWRLFSSKKKDSHSYLMTAIEDQHGNRISLTYDDETGLLLEIVDSAGRLVRLAHGSDRHIARVEVRNAPLGGGGQWETFTRYAYDQTGNLVEVTDADGSTVAFTYDDEHHLTSETRADGLRFCFLYDEQRRCVETWGEQIGGPLTSLSPDAPTTIADGTPAKGLLHCRLTFMPGATEVVNSRRLIRYLLSDFGTVAQVVDGAGVVSRTFDENGNTLSETDPLGQTKSYTRDAEGRVLTSTDEAGHLTKFERDASGRIVAVTDAAGFVTKAHRDTRGRVTLIELPNGGVHQFEYDTRGLVTREVEPNGGQWRYSYDSHGNMVSLVMPNGGVWQFTYDHLGRPLKRVGPNGAAYLWVFSPTGRVVAEHASNGTTKHFEYDSVGNLVRATTPSGTWRLAWGGYDSMIAVEAPDGSRITCAYDRECDLIAVTNERGEVQRYERDSLGHLLSEISFDGRRMEYRRDLLGRKTHYTDAIGNTTEFVYDSVGQVVERIFADGTTEKYRFDPRGLQLGADTPDCSLVFERDAEGAMVRELQTVDGKTIVVEKAYDPNTNQVRLHSSLGYSEDIARDVMGARQVTTLGTVRVLHERDLFGQEASRQLPFGGRIENAFDVTGALLRRTVKTGSLAGDGQPEWVGDGRPAAGVAIEHSYQYDPAGRLQRRQTWVGGGVRATTFRQDQRSRLIEAIPDVGLARKFAYDVAGNLHEADPTSPGRVYGPGNRLLRRGTDEFVYDAEGQLVERRMVDGTWYFEWNQAGRLTAVVTPQGRRSEFRYDAFGRRVSKLVLAPPAFEGEPAVLERKLRFVWSGERLLQEVEEAGSTSGTIRDYCFDDDGVTPIAQRRGGDWEFFVTDEAARPQQLVAGDGSVLFDFTESTWGVQESRPPTPLLFAGQYFDEETGLAYNRNRYYDPDTARYISPDPLELRGGLNVYSYVPDPHTWIDPSGLYKGGTHFADAHFEDPDGNQVGPGLKPDKTSSDDPMKFDSKQHNVGPKGKKTTSDADFQKVLDKPDNKAYMDDKSKSAQQKNGRKSQLSHTEQKITAKAAKDPRAAPPNKLVINGRSPPCSTCQVAMQEFANEKGIPVVYNHDGGSQTFMPSQ
ncbi:MAG: hypothetical protein JNL79_18775 [Myxococcales bacterium]|nr:hypothetical protein [Myxococcales bacterium]